MDKSIGTAVHNSNSDLTLHFKYIDINMESFPLSIYNSFLWEGFPPRPTPTPEKTAL